MKKVILSRFFSALLCLMLVLGLSACGEKNEQPPTDGNKGTAGVLSGEKGDTTEGDSQKVDPEKAEAALVMLRKYMSKDDQLAGAVAYLGQRGPHDDLSMADWLHSNADGLVSEMPFLLEIPEERILGIGYGDLFCIVPRDESTSLAVNHVTWKSQGNGVWPVVDEVLYREEYAQPVLVFVNFEEWPDEPDTEICLVTNNGLEVNWNPLADESGCPVVPTGVDYAPMLMDFGVFGYTTGLDYPWDWEPEGDDWWLPPTDEGLADTTWIYDDWLMELRCGECSPDYAGVADLYHRFEADADLTRVYSGVWRMEDDCLRLEVSDDAGNTVSGSFPILISPSGEEMHFQRSRSGEGVPFLPDGVDTIELALSYG